MTEIIESVTRHGGDRDGPVTAYWRHASDEPPEPGSEWHHHDNSQHDSDSPA